MDSVLLILGLNLGLVVAGMIVLWLVSLRLRDVSIVDIAWGAAGALIALSTFLATDGPLPRRILLTGMTVIWGVRLSLHIGFRKRGKGEDFRYAAMREEHGTSFPLRSLFTVFLLQAVLIWLIALPAQLGQIAPTPEGITPLDLLGLGVWTVGIAFESVADAQLRAFLAHPENRGRVMDRGLWRYSRHPNYFGDSLVWWGIYLSAAAVPWGWTLVVSPLLMTFFLRKVSGVPLLEKSLAERRVGYREYMTKTSAFFPLPPRKE